MNHNDKQQPPDRVRPDPPAAYEPPQIVDLGSLRELTLGNDITISDGLAGSGSGS